MNPHTAARRNGVQGQQDAERLLGLQTATNELLDILVNNSAIEIKSCRTVVSDKSFGKGWRWGRFGFSGPQHVEMLELDGMYLFMLYGEGGFLIHAHMVSASTVEARSHIKPEGKTMWAWPRVLSRRPRISKKWRGSETTLLDLFGYGRISIE